MYSPDVCCVDLFFGGFLYACILRVLTDFGNLALPITQSLKKIAPH